MDSMDRFVIEQNVWHFIHRLAQESDPDTRLTLARLLLREEDKFAKDLERLEAVERWIDKCDELIRVHKKLQPTVANSNDMETQSALDTMQEIRRTLVSLRLTWKRHAEETAAFTGSVSQDC